MVSNTCGLATNHPVKLIVGSAAAQPAIFATVTPGPTGAPMINLTWFGTATTPILEFSYDLVRWQPVTPQPSGNSFSEPLSGPAKFYRLRSP